MWGVPGRADLLDELVGSFEAASRGLALIGPHGVGKSLLLDELAAWFERSGSLVHRIVGELTSVDELTPVGPDCVLAVDSADRLTADQALAVANLVEAGEARLVLASRSAASLAPTLADLVQRGTVRRVDVGPLDRAATAAVAESIAGRPLSSGAARRLWEVTAGSPLLMREIMLAIGPRGLTGDHDLGADIIEIPMRSPRLVDVLGNALRGLSESDVEVVRHLAFAEPCRLEELDGIADRATLIRLERHGIIHSTSEDRGIVVRLVVPFHSGVMRALTSPLQRQSILARCVSQLAAVWMDHPAEVLKLAQLSIESGVDIDGSLLQHAASLAFHAGYHPLSEQVGRQAIANTGSFSVGWDVANSLLVTGAATRFRRFVADWRALADRPAYHAAVAFSEGNLAFWCDGDDGRAAEAFHRALSHLEARRTPRPDDPDVPSITAGEVVAERAVQLAVSGRPAEALTSIGPYLDDDSVPVFVRVRYAAGLALLALARVDEAVAMLDAALAVVERAGQESVSLPAQNLRAVRARARLDLGDLDGAMDDAVAVGEGTSSPQDLLLSAMLVSLVNVMLGRPLTALAGIERVSWSSESNQLRLVRRSFLAVRALCRAAARHDAEARADLVRLDADTHPSVTYDVWVDLARSWVGRRAGSENAAIDELWATLERLEIAAAADATDAVAAGGQRFRMIMVLHELMRGSAPAEPARRLLDLLAETPGEIAQAMRHHATGLLNGSVTELEQATELYASVKLWFTAGQLALRLSDLARQTGDGRGSTRWLRIAADHFGQCDGQVPSALVVGSPVTLTRREREIAQLAAMSRSSKEIAATLFISRRTVENHLARIYDKLGVHSRAELATALAGSPRARRPHPGSDETRYAGPGSDENRFARRA